MRQRAQKLQSAERVKRDRSPGYFHGEAATVASEDAADGYLAPSLLAAGADAQGVALLSALSRLPLVFLYTCVPRIMKEIGSRKKTLLILAVISTLTWLPLIAVLIFLRPVSPFWLLVCCLISLTLGALTIPARDSWLADTSPAKSMGRYLGLRSFISAAVYLGMFYIMGYVLDLFTGQVFVGFAAVFGLAFVASLAKVVVYSRIRDAVNTQRQVEFSFGDFLEETRRGSLGRFILYLSLLNFAVYLCSPFFAVYLVTYLKFNYMTFAIVFSADFIARALSASIWGRYADRIGSFPILDKISYLIPLIPVLWLVSSNVVYLLLVQLLSGILWAGFEVCSQSLIYRAASPQKRQGYIVYHRSLITLGQALGALFGAYLFSHMIPILGSKIFGLFVLSGILRFAVAKALLPSISRVRPVIGSGPSSETLVPELHTEIAWPEDGLYHRPQDWAKYMSPAWKAALASVKRGPVAARGLYHKVEEWAKYAQPALASVKRDPVAARGLYHKVEEWAKYAQPVQASVKRGPVAARGLYHKAEEWAKYAQPAQASVKRDPVVARGLYHKAEEWAKYAQPALASA